MGLVAKKHRYDAAASSPPVTVNGARLRLQLKPEGSAGGSFAVSAMVVGAAVATLDGPFRWRIEASDESGHCEWLTIHRLRTRTAGSGRDEAFPREHLGQRAEFLKPVGSAGPARAVYEIPGLLQVKPRDDGDLEIDADISVKGNGRITRKQVRFRLKPSEKRQNEWIFVPTEIVRSFGKDRESSREKGWE